MKSETTRIPCPDPRRLPTVKKPFYNVVARCGGLDLALHAELYPDYHRLRVEMGADALNARADLLEACASGLLGAAHWARDEHPYRVVVNVDLGGALRVVLESRVEEQPPRLRLFEVDDALVEECGLRARLEAGSELSCWGRLYAGYRFGYAVLGLGWEGVCRYASRLLSFTPVLLRALIGSYPGEGIFSKRRG